MFALAFKKAALTGSNWSKLIAWKTNGPYSHVELWLDGPRASATCFSSREGSGCSFQTLDLTAPVWDLIELPSTSEQVIQAKWFCLGASGKNYDYIGLFGLDSGTGKHNDHNRFCSEVCIEVIQKVLGKLLDQKMWMVSPNKLAKLLNETQN